MVSRSLLSLLIAATTSTSITAFDSYAASNGGMPSNLRGSTPSDEEASTSEDHIPDLADTRKLVTDDGAWRSIQNDTEINQKLVKTIEGTEVFISEKCLTTLSATADEYGRLGKENYYVFNDAMSNGYYSSINVTSYSEMPMDNKFSFVTLSCQCHAFGGAGNCCQGPRANINVAGIDDPETMSEQLTQYISDICETTIDAIGVENILPPTGEGSWTPRPTTSPTVSSAPSVSSMPSDGPTMSSAPTVSSAPSMKPSVSHWPTDSPSVSVAPTVSSKPSPVGGFPGASEPTGGGNSTDVDGGLGAGPIAGIAIAGVAVLALAAFLLLGRRGNQDEEENSSADNDIEQMSTQNNTKERLAITANGELDPDAPDGPQSPDATNSMTASDVSSIPSMSTKGKKGGSATTGAASSYYAKNSLLGGRPDEESMLSSSDGPSFFSTDDDTDEFGFETSLAGKDSLTKNDKSLDDAIESGNWEEVAASAAKYVKNSEPRSLSSSSMEV